MSLTAIQVTTESGAGVVIDVAPWEQSGPARAVAAIVAFGLLFGVFGIALIVGEVVKTALASAGTTAVSIASFLAMIGCFLFVPLVHYVWLRIRFDSVIDPLLEISTPEELAGALGTRKVARVLGWNWLVRRLSDAGFTGATVRICEGRWAAPVKPFIFTFEPLPVDENNVTVVALLDATSSESETTAGSGEPIERSPKSDPQKAADAAAGRASEKLSRWTYRVAVLFGVTFTGTVFAVRLWQTRFQSASELLALAVLTVFGGITLLRWASGLGVYVVSGGLVDFRRRRWWRVWQADEPRLFERRSSVLVTYASGPRGDRRTVIVADARGAAAVSISPREQELVLRAWTSPLRPPSAELVRSLANVG